MAIYNILAAEMECPRCGDPAEFRVQLHFGRRELVDYRLGDRYSWVPRKAVQNGGRPPDGDLDGEGYTECPLCAKDFFVCVEIRGDRLSGARPDTSREPYVRG